MYPVILGTSKPAYTSAELKQFEQQSREKVTVEGVTKTRYEWTQWQRKCETDASRLKNAANAAAAAGDDALRRECQGKINELQKAYSLVSAEAGLEPQKERMSVSGFHAVKDEKPAAQYRSWSSQSKSQDVHAKAEVIQPDSKSVQLNIQDTNNTVLKSDASSSNIINEVVSSYRYNDDGTIAVTDDWKGRTRITKITVRMPMIL